MNKILIIIDMQNDFITGSLGTKEARAIVPKVEKKIEEYQERNEMIIFTRDTHKNNYLETSEGIKLPVKHCIYNTKGWKIGIKSIPGEYKIIDKMSFGYDQWRNVFGKYFSGYLGSHTTVELVGLCTDICVISNALLVKAALPEVPIIVDAACCAGVTPESHETALKAMKACQIDVVE